MKEENIRQLGLLQSSLKPAVDSLNSLGSGSALFGKTDGSGQH